MAVLASGTVAATDTALYTDSNPNTPTSVTVLFQNTSGSQSQTILVSLTPSGGTELQCFRFVLGANEQGFIVNLPIGNGDVLSASTSNASTVNFLVYPGSGSAFSTFCLDASGYIKYSPISTATVAQTITSSSANALAVGPSGTSNPTFNVDASTASAITGIDVVGAASGAGVVVKAQGSANEGFTLQAKGTGAITLGSTTASTTTMIVTPAGSGSGIAMQVGGGGSNEALTIDAKASALITMAGAAASATGVQVGSSTSKANSRLISFSTNANALAVGANGTTNPALQVDASTSSSATGVKIKSAADAAGVAISVISTNTNEAVTIDAKGSGLITIGSVSTGGCAVRLPVATVAASGTAIGNAAAVTEGFTYVTGGNNAAAVILPVAGIGAQVTIVNTVANATLQVFPQVNSQINAKGANAVYNVPNGGERTFKKATATLWYTAPETIV